MDDERVGTFVSWDYVVFACLFAVSSGIGVFFAVKERKNPSSEFLVGGRQMTCGPVALSLTASFMSAVTVLGAPSDVYRSGGSFVLFGVAYTFVVIATAELFVPVFYRSGITSTYEYLERRFCKGVRMAATLIYILQTILYTGVVVYAPALALNQVTGFNLWGSIFATGVVCTFYCTLGGLKAVVWTDAFQMVVMVVGFMTVLVQGTRKTGGAASVWEVAKNGNRLDIFDFDPDPLRRHTFWTISIGGTFTWLGIYGVNQSTIQRCISCKTETHAKLALYFNLLGLLVILVCAVFSGLIMYAFYANCDPWTAQSVTAPDQLMPYFVMEILGGYPGLPGLFVACAFSGTLSTVAASINALATVTYEDFVKQCCTNLSNKASGWISKGLCIVFGVACTTMAVAASYMGGIVQAALSIHGMCGGPMLGLFSLGIVFPWTNSMGAAGGLTVGIALSFWAGVGAFIYPALDINTRPLSLSIEGCLQPNSSDPTTSVPPSYLDPTALPSRSSLADHWYSMSYLYYSAVGFLATVTAGLLISFITGHTRSRDVKPWLLRPVCNLFCFWSKKYKKMCWCGVNHELKQDMECPDADTVKDEGPFVKEDIGRKGMKRKIQPAKNCYNLQEKAHDNAGFTEDTKPF
ncbi:sodium-coupled monocarboxylate transporter 2 isoform X2 [Salmo salar]|uniref:Sodium-coupled monocarboxylate transporter 2 n=1 Tax=Salmo salar TaxID=8030 RepID=C0HAI3_SALSA|nr:sodium-coupled monocarboxylate transporter 2 [Salmo salar]XP_045543152.1 sodium-coupled monocarboxylate transporter 2 isoform X2 [Salmo salar]ACN11052.1 Sodium/iodide cotransporter [Salmo salar]|eukprot:NP_001167196.1 sodium-coupled monocarboxylate transporter 2 [Salmo salar]